MGGNNFTVDVAYSFKTKVINGSEISTRYPLALTVTSKPSWVTNVAITTLSSDNGNYGLTLTLTENTVESTRSGTIKLRQAENDEGIYNGVYYTTDIVNIINEVTMQKQNALNILNNRPKFEAIVSECDNILNSINQSPSAPSKPAPGFEEFRQYMDQRISTQETLLQRIAQELGLDKPKQQ